MSLINCPECGREISDKAPACPGCGVPILTTSETNAQSVQITSVQETEKKLKAHILLASISLFVGLFWLIIAAYNDEPTVFPVLLLFVGLVWYFIAKILIWWGHG